MGKYFFVLIVSLCWIEFGFSQKEDVDTFPFKKNILRAIVLSSNEIWCYNKNIEHKKRYSIKNSNNFHSLILQQKKLYGDSLIIFIKPTSKTNVNEFDDVAQQILNDSVGQLGVLGLRDEEMKAFDVKNFFLLPPPPIEITTPKIVSTKKQVGPDSDEVALIFEFDGSPTIFYSIKTQKDSIEGKVLKEQAKIESIITKAQLFSKEQNKLLTVLIKGDNKAAYSEFKTLIDALKSKEIYKYRLITTPE